MFLFSRKTKSTVECRVIGQLTEKLESVINDGTIYEKDAAGTKRVSKEGRGLILRLSMLCGHSVDMKTALDTLQQDPSHVLERARERILELAA